MKKTLEINYSYELNDGQMSVEYDASDDQIYISERAKQQSGLFPSYVSPSSMWIDGENLDTLIELLTELKHLKEVKRS